MRPGEKRPPALSVWAAPEPIRAHGLERPAHDVRTELGAIEFRADFGDMDIRSVHHNVAKLDAARAFLKSEDWPLNVMSIARRGRSG
jgi:hypothetical protein